MKNRIKNVAFIWITCALPVVMTGCSLQYEADVQAKAAYFEETSALEHKKENIWNVKSYTENIYSKIKPEQLLAYVDAKCLVVDEQFEGAQTINNYLLEYYEDRINEVRKDAVEGYQMIHNETFMGEYYYGYTSSDPQIGYLDDRWLSFYQEDYFDWGGPHGMPYWISHTFDLQTGRQLGLRDIIQNSEEELKDIVTKYFTELIDQDSDAYWQDALTIVREQTTLSSDFYLSEEGIHFYFAPYELACYASGFQEVTIPYDAFRLRAETAITLKNLI